MLQGMEKQGEVWQR